MYPTSLVILPECITVTTVATSLFRRDGPYIAQLLGGRYFTNAVKSRITTNLKKKVKDYGYTVIYPEEYTLNEINAESDSHSSTSVKEKLNDSEDEDECQGKLYYKITVLV